jgi:hypothetical protein
MARGSAAEFDGNGETPGSGDNYDPDVLKARSKNATLTFSRLPAR